MTQQQEHRLVYSILGLFAIVMIYLAIMTEGTGDWGDAIYHYLFAKYAFIHPENFLNHWAKPVFVLFAAPVAQGGFVAMKLFNVALLLGSTYLAWRLGKALAIPNSWLVIFPMMTAPMNISHVLSGLTEPMFACWLMLGIYLFVKKKPFLAVLLLSFLPFVRSEGLIVFCVLAIYLLLKRWWYLLPLLATGHVVYSLVGYFYYQDFLWVFNKMPYATVEGAYGAGDFWHYANKMHQVMGDFSPIVLVIGLIAGAIKWINYLRGKAIFLKEELWLVYGISVAFFIAHSIFWKFGIFNSFGLTRVFIGVLPLYSLIIVQAINLVVSPLSSKLHFPIFGILIAMMAWYLDKSIDIPYHLAPTPAQRGQTALIEKYAPQYPDYTYYFDAIHPGLALDIDWFDPAQHRYTPQLFTGEPIPKKSVVLWDDWFSKDESNMPLERLLADKRFKLIECLETGHDWQEIKNKNCLFEFDPAYGDAAILQKIDFEDAASTLNLDSTTVKTGKYSLRLDKQLTFANGFNGWMNSFQHQKNAYIQLSCWVYVSNNINLNAHTAKAVISFESKYKSFAYHDLPVFQKEDQVGTWKQLRFEQRIPSPKLLSDQIKVYLWNPDATPIYVDDIEVSWYSK